MTAKLAGSRARTVGFSPRKADPIRSLLQSFTTHQYARAHLTGHPHMPPLVRAVRSAIQRQPASKRSGHCRQDQRTLLVITFFVSKQVRRDTTGVVLCPAVCTEAA